MMNMVPIKKQKAKKSQFYKKAAIKEKKAQKQQNEVQVFPSIPRKIPESPSIGKLILNKYFLVSFISTFLSVAIALQGFDMLRDVQRLREAQSKRQEIVREVAYWEGVTKQYADYRDAYFRLALLEYQLGNKEQARMHLRRTLEIDPNFEQGREFQERIGE